MYHPAHLPFHPLNHPGSASLFLQALFKGWFWAPLFFLSAKPAQMVCSPFLNPPLLFHSIPWTLFSTSLFFNCPQGNSHQLDTVLCRKKTGQCSWKNVGSVVRRTLTPSLTTYTSIEGKRPSRPPFSSYVGSLAGSGDSISIRDNRLIREKA